jgi:hypothetical protein
LRCYEGEFSMIFLTNSQKKAIISVSKELPSTLLVHIILEA